VYGTVKVYHVMEAVETVEQCFFLLPYLVIAGVCVVVPMLVRFVNIQYDITSATEIL